MFNNKYRDIISLFVSLILLSTMVFMNVLLSDANKNIDSLKEQTIYLKNENNNMKSFYEEQIALLEVNGEEKCLTGVAIFETEFGYIRVGDVQFCGMNGAMTGVYGPNLETFIEKTEIHNAELYNELQRWKACVLDNVCTEGMK